MRNAKTDITKKIILTLLSVVLCACVLTACSGSNNSSATTDESLGAELVGTWHEDLYDSGYVFNADGTGTDTFWDLDFTYTIPEAGKIHVVFNEDMWGETDYTYTIENGVLRLTLSNDGSTIEYTKK